MYRIVSFLAVLAVAARAAALAPGVAAQAQTPQPSQPSFQAGVELVTIDVQVTPAKDGSLRDLTAADFEVRVSGHKRSVAAVTLVHYDDGPVVPHATMLHGGDPSTCVFGRQRKTNQTTAHYVVAIDRTDSDRTEVKQVSVKLVDKDLVAERYVWRSPVRRGIRGSSGTQ